MGIYYEDSGQYQEAYETFKTWFGLMSEMYGINNPQTQRAIRVLNEPLYKRLACSANEKVPSIDATK